MQTVPLIFIIELCPLPIVNSRVMSLVCLRLVSSYMGIHVESFLMVAVDNPSNSILSIGSSIRLESSFIEVVLVFCIGKRSGIWLEILNVFLYLLKPFLLFKSLFFLLSFPNPLPDLYILTVFFASFFLRLSRPRPISRIERSILRNICVFVGNGRIIDD